MPHLPDPIPRALAPLPGEGLPGLLLRLSHRLDMSPLQVLVRAGAVKPPAASVPGQMLVTLGSRLKLFAHSTRLTPQEAAALTLEPHGERFPPVTESLRIQTQHRFTWARIDPWVLSTFTRYCPKCLAGDGSVIQRRHGGPWKAEWRLAVSFICRDHRTFLRQLCPTCRRPAHKFDKRAVLHPMQHRTSVMKCLLPGRIARYPGAHRVTGRAVRQIQRCCIISNMSDAQGMPGAAHLVLAQGVVHLDPEPAVFDAMLEGWARQQRSRFLNFDATVKPRLALLKRFAEFSNLYPWQWQPGEVEAFLDHLRGRRPTFAVSTARNYQNAIRMFCDYITDERYDWPKVCYDSFGQQPAQILHEWNTITHSSEYEGGPGRRPLTYDEVQQLFDAADGRVDSIRKRRRKGALAALRDAMVLKIVYAYGLRRQETCGLDLADMRRNAKVPSYGRFGGVFVRYGKASKGGPPKRRLVLTVPEMDWSVDVLEQYWHEVRPSFSPGRHPALWVTDRRGRLSLRRLNEAFDTARQEADLPEELDLHSLRHSYVTHLIEFGYPERFVQDQVGHAYASTTAIYTGVSDDYRNRLLERSLKERHSDLWEEPA